MGIPAERLGIAAPEAFAPRQVPTHAVAIMGSRVPIRICIRNREAT